MFSCVFEVINHIIGLEIVIPRKILHKFASFTFGILSLFRLGQAQAFSYHAFISLLKSIFFCQPARIFKHFIASMQDCVYDLYGLNTQQNDNLLFPIGFSYLFYRTSLRFAFLFTCLFSLTSLSQLTPGCACAIINIFPSNVGKCFCFDSSILHFSKYMLLSS